MSNLVELAADTVTAFKKSEVGTAMPLQESIKLAESSPEIVAERFYVYYRVIRDLLRLPPEEIALISSVNEELGTGRGADNFLVAMGEHKEKVMAHLRQIGDDSNPNNRLGMNELARMMSNAWKIKQSDTEWVPRDGDPKADNVIWGFVKGASDPQTDIDFTICHGIERILTECFGDNEFTHHKDWLLCALNDVIALRGLAGRGPEAALLSLWTTPRPEGLGWIGKDRLDAYKSFVFPLS